MKKTKIVSIILCVSMLLSCATAGASTIDVTLNGEPASFGSANILSNEYIMVPLRDMAESISYKVEWNDTAQCAVIIKVDDVINVYVNSNIYEVNGESYTLPCDTVLYGSKTYVPFAFFKAITPMSVVWDYDALKLDITSDAFPNKDGIFAAAPEATVELQGPYFTDFSDPYDFYAENLANTPTSENFVGKSQYGDGWYHASAKIEAIGGSATLTSWNWFFKLSNFFKGYKAGEYKIKFKVRSKTNDANKSGDAINMQMINVGDSVTSGATVRYNQVFNIIGVADTEWKTVEKTFTYSGKCTDAGDGFDSYALVIQFYSDKGAWYAIDDVEITPVS